MAYESPLNALMAQLPGMAMQLYQTEIQKNQKNEDRQFQEDQSALNRLFEEKQLADQQIFQKQESTKDRLLQTKKYEDQTKANVLQATHNKFMQESQSRMDILNKEYQAASLQGQQDEALRVKERYDKEYLDNAKMRELNETRMESENVLRTYESDKVGLGDLLEDFEGPQGKISESDIVADRIPFEDSNFGQNVLNSMAEIPGLGWVDGNMKTIDASPITDYLNQKSTQVNKYLDSIPNIPKGQKQNLRKLAGDKWDTQATTKIQGLIRNLLYSQGEEKTQSVLDQLFETTKWNTNLKMSLSPNAADYMELPQLKQ